VNTLILFDISLTLLLNTIILLSLSYGNIVATSQPYTTNGNEEFKPKGAKDELLNCDD
jgi:hypothetical protein